MSERLMKRCWRNFENWKDGNVCDYGAATSCAMTERRPPLDSARQMGIGSTSHEFFGCSGDLSRGGEVC